MTSIKFFTIQVGCRGGTRVVVETMTSLNQRQAILTPSSRLCNSLYIMATHRVCGEFDADSCDRVET